MSHAPRLLTRRHFSTRLCRSFSSSPRWTQQHSLPASYYRGGYSRAVIFHVDDLPSDRAAWTSIFQRVLGSPDPTHEQLDGLGFGVQSLSKICVVEPTQSSEAAVADVAYTVAQVGIRNGAVSFERNCGNMTAAIAPWAWDHGLVPRGNDRARSGKRIVKMLNRNTGMIIRATVAVQDGKYQPEGDMVLAGVPGTGSPVRLDYMDPAGSQTGELLPTGNVIDVLEGTQVTCIDAGHACVFVRAEDVGERGTVLTSDLDKDVVLLKRLERIRQAAGIAMAVADPETQPSICLVSSPKASKLRTNSRPQAGDRLRADEMDILARAVQRGKPHRTIPTSIALCLAAAAQLEGGVVYECVPEKKVDERGLTIGHASGTLLASAKIDRRGHLMHAGVFLTARRIMDGTVYWHAP